MNCIYSRVCIQSGTFCSQELTGRFRFASWVSFLDGKRLILLGAAKFSNLRFLLFGIRAQNSVFYLLRGDVFDPCVRNGGFVSHLSHECLHLGRVEVHLVVSEELLHSDDRDVPMGATRQTSDKVLKVNVSIGVLFFPNHLKILLNILWSVHKVSCLLFEWTDSF